MSDIIVYDLEVYKYDWFVTIKSIKTKEYTKIHNDTEKIKEFYAEHKNDIWAGHNSIHYDNIIIKCILKDITGPELKQISNDIIENEKGKYIIKKYNLNEIQLFSFDVMLYRIKYSLKEVEGYLGMSIEETKIPFNLDRPLTNEEIETVFKYNQHDVDATVEEVFLRLDFFETKILLLKQYNLPFNMIDYSDQQLCAEILQADYTKFKDGKQPYDLNVAPIDIKKYTECVDFFTNVKELDYDRELKIDIANVPHVLSNGGIHGAIDSYYYEGNLWLVDVGSYYPNMMINFDLCSRAMSSPDNFKNLVKTRMNAKSEKSKLEEELNKPLDIEEKNKIELKINKISKLNDALKLPINITSGAMKAPFSKLYDERNNNWMCITGQLLLVDLLEKIEKYSSVIQSNTDGIIIIPNDEKECNKVIKEWEDKTGLILEKTVATKIYQKDVNNYILLDNKGHVKTKGAFVGQYHNEERYKNMLRRNMEIVDDAVVDYLLYDKPLEDTIINYDAPLLKYQIIKKLGNMYDDIVLYRYNENGELVYNRDVNRINRIFATTDKSYGKLMKKHFKKDKYDSVEGCPDNCLVYNSDVRQMTPKDISLDFEWYINQAKSRIIDFILSNEEKKEFRKSSFEELWTVVLVKLGKM